MSEVLDAVSVEVYFPETPFGGVQVFGASDNPIQIVLREGIQGEPGEPGPVGPAGPISDAPGSSGVTASGITPLVPGQSFIHVVFPAVQPDANWFLLECVVLNTADSIPLNILTGIMTVKNESGFTIQLNGKPDSPNYALHWSISGVVIPPAPPTPATSYLLSGPTDGEIGFASSDFTVALPAGQVLTGPVVVTPSDGGAGGTFTPATVTLTTP